MGDKNCFYRTKQIWGKKNPRYLSIVFQNKRFFPPFHPLPFTQAHLPLTGHFLQLFWGDTEAFPSNWLLFNVEEWYLYSEPLLNDRSPYPVCKGEPWHLLRESSFPPHLSAVSFFQSPHGACGHRWAQERRCSDKSTASLLRSSLISPQWSRLRVYITGDAKPICPSSSPFAPTREQDPEILNSFF